MNALAMMMRRPRTFSEALPDPNMLPPIRTIQPPEGGEAMEFDQNELARRILLRRAFGSDV
jgi:hypothetical protein